MYLLIQEVLMNTSFQIFSRDVKRLLRNRAAALVMVGVCLLPSLYAWFNIAANMDPYGNTKGIKVAVANNDKGAVTEMITLDAGDTIIENLKKNDQLGWTFTNEKKAKEGVKSGDYYAAIVIPEDFSESLVSILSGDLKKPELDYYINEKKNAIAPKITDTGATTIQHEINDTFSSVASEAVADIIRTAADDIAGDISSTDWHLFSEIAEVRANISEYQTVLTNFQNTVSRSDDVIQSTIKSLDKVDTAADAASSALGDTSDLLTQSRIALGKFAAQFSKTLSDGDILLNDIAVSTSTKLGAFETKVLKASAAVDSDIASANELIKKNEQILQKLEELNDKVGSDSQLSAQIAQQIAELQAQNKELNDLLDSLSSGNAAIGEAVTAAQETRTELEKIAEQNRKSLQDFRGDFDQNLLPKINQSLDDLAQVSGSLSATLAGVKPVTKQLRGVLQQLGTSLDSTAAALAQTGNILKLVDQDLENIINDIKALQSSEMYKKLLSLEGLDTEAISDFMASPVSMRSDVLYDVENYGSGMTPFYTNLAIWVGGLILVSILKQEVDKEGLAHGLTATDAYFGRWMLYVAAALVQAFIVCLGDLLLLGVQCVHPFVFILTGLVCAFVYVNIIYALAITFKHIGKAVAVILIILQIPGSSGTYPIEMMPSFFQKLYPLLPFSYGIDAMRDCIAGFYGFRYIGNILILIVFAGIALLVGLILRPLLINLNHMTDSRLSETEIMICDTETSRSDRPKIRTMLKTLMRDEYGKQRLMARYVRFERMYPDLIKRGFICMIVIPLIFLVLMLVVDARMLFLVLWILSLIFLSVYLICIEYVHDRMQEQFEMSGKTSEDLIHMIEEEND